MGKACLISFLVCLIFIELTYADNKTISNRQENNAVMWNELFRTIVTRAKRTSDSCVALYNFDSSLVKEMYEASKDVLPSGIFLAESLKVKHVRHQRARPLCFGFMARFATMQDALDFAVNKNEGGQFLKPNSLGVILIEKILNTTEVGKILDSGCFERSPQLAILAQQRLGSFISVYSRRISAMPTGPDLIDKWKMDSGAFILGGNNLFSVQQKNFHGRTLRVATFDYAPFTTSRPPVAGREPEFDGIEISIFYEISKALNLTYTINEPQTGSRFTGVTSDLQARVADVGIAHLFLLYNRVVLMRLDHPNAINMDHYTFLVPPAKRTPRWQALLLAFDIPTWLGFLTALLSCCLFAYFYTKYEEDNYGIHFQDYLFTYLAICTQELWLTSQKIEKQSIRIHMLCVLGPLFVLTTLYKGSYFSLLLSPIYSKPMETFEEVLDSDLSVYSLSGVLQWNLSNDSDSKLLRLAEKSFKHTNVYGALYNVSQGLQVVTESEQMIRYRINLDFIDSSGKPTVHVSHQVNNYAVTFFLQECSPYRDPINKVLESLVESGITNKILTDALGRLEVRDVVQEQKKLDIKGAFPAFLALMLFGTLCVMVVLLECLYGFPHNHRPRRIHLIHIEMY